MVNLLTRRREMILQSGSSEGPLLYSLENRTVEDGEVIDTGVAPLRAGENMTILFDMTITRNPTNTAQAYRYVLFRIESSTRFDVYKPSQWNANIRARFCGSGDTDGTGNIASSATGRKRIVVTHEANSDHIVAIGKNGDNPSTTKTISRASSGWTPSSNETLHFGWTGTGFGLPPGTIHLAQVYNTILSQEEIDAFLA